MTAEETIAAAREIRAALPNDDSEAMRCCAFESDYYASRQLNHGPQMEKALANLRRWIVMNRHRVTENIMNL